jgi:hypothetical protein
MRIFILTDDETSDKKPILFLRKCAKTHVRQCSISKIFPGLYPGPPFRGREEGRKRGGVLGGNTGSGAVGEKTREGMEEDRVGNGRGKWEGREREGKGGGKGKGREDPQPSSNTPPVSKSCIKAWVIRRISCSRGEFKTHR